MAQLLTDPRKLLGVTAHGIFGGKKPETFIPQTRQVVPAKYGCFSGAKTLISCARHHRSGVRLKGLGDLG